MHKRSVRRIGKLALIGALFTSLQACSPISSSPQSSVADAYHSSGAIAIQPYNRTIFSSNNF